MRILDGAWLRSDFVFIISGYPAHLSYQFPLGREGHRALDTKEKDCMDVYISLFLCWKSSVHRPLYVQSADFVRKDLTYCFPALFVIMYILTLSDVIHAFKFGCEVNVGTGLQQLSL